MVAYVFRTAAIYPTTWNPPGVEPEASERIRADIDPLNSRTLGFVLLDFNPK